MNGLKHILIAIAMLAAVAPCLHAGDHGTHIHDSGARTELCASHVCSCHACDTTAVCADDLSVQLQKVSSAVPVVQSTSLAHLFTLAETRPVLVRAPFSFGGVLASLKSIQLLI